jgi:polar amino acid transport system substrate-binding protein
MTEGRPIRMFGAFLALTVSILAASPLHAQTDVAQRLAPKGELRAAVVVSDSVLVRRDQQGQLSGVLVDIANALAAKLGVPLHLVPYENVVRYNQSIGKDEWDVALAVRDISRIERLGFSTTLVEIDSSYVTRPGNRLTSVDEVDHSGTRVAVTEHSTADGFVTRTLRKAQIIRLPTGIEEAREALAFGRADVYAGNTQFAYQIAERLPGATVLVGRLNSAQISFAVPKSNASVLSALNDFIQEARKDGTIADAIKRAGLRGVRPGH